MRIAILVTSKDTSDFAARHPHDGHKFARLLKRHRPEWVCDSYFVWQGERAADLAAYDGVLITGSPASVNDPEPWIDALMDDIRAIVARKQPLVGACFGHQAIARALGGTVEKWPGGWSLGQEVTTFTQRFDWMDPPARELSLYSAHKDQVTVLPDEARSIGSNPFCRFPAFVIGDHVMTTEYHPEMDHAFLLELCDEMDGVVSEPVLAKARQEFARASDGAQFGRWIVNFFEVA